MAPEVFKHEEYDTKVDVFSFALILQEVKCLSFDPRLKLFLRVGSFILAHIPATELILFFGFLLLIEEHGINILYE